MVVGWMESTKGQNIARRFLALMITGTWLLLYWGGVFVSIAATITDDPTNIDKLKQVAEIMSTSAGDMDAPVMLIMSFYFAAPHMSKIIDSFGSKKKLA